MLDVLVRDILAIINNQKAAGICLSKGGWEGWLQCEFWAHLTLQRGLSVEREVAYPGSAVRCDLVIHGVPGSHPTTWVELKAYGAFREGDADRFLDAVAVDVSRLEPRNRPGGSQGFALAVVPKAIEDSFVQKIIDRGWNGFTRAENDYVIVYHIAVQ